MPPLHPVLFRIHESKKGPPQDREGLLIIYLLSLAYLETVNVTAEALALMEYLEVVPL